MCNRASLPRIEGSPQGPNPHTLSAPEILDCAVCTLESHLTSSFRQPGDWSPQRHAPVRSESTPQGETCKWSVSDH